MAPKILLIAVAFMGRSFLDQVASAAFAKLVLLNRKDLGLEREL